MQETRLDLISDWYLNRMDGLNEMMPVTGL
jgi:hypothetical protein